MYKLLIVDDEALARYALRKILSENFIYIDVIKEAESGKEAIKLSKQYKPDIVIMDIKMPGLNGIEASKEILRLKKDTKILILTAYDDFEYAQEAIDIGIKGYLLKPIEHEQAIIKIRKLIKEVESEKTHKNSYESSDEKIKRVKPIIEKELIDAIIRGNIDVREIKKYINFLQYNLKQAYFMIISYKQDEFNTINSSIMNKRNGNKVIEIIKKYMPYMCKFILGNMIGNKIVVLIYNESDSINNQYANSISIAKNIERKALLTEKIQLYVGIGQNYDDVNNYKKSYNQANSALRETKDDNNICHYNDLNILNIKISENNYPLDLEYELVQKLNVAPKEECILLSNKITQQIIFSNSEINIIKENIVQLIYNLKKEMLKFNIKIKKVISIIRFTELENIYEAAELKLWADDVLFNLIEIIYENSDNNESHIMYEIYNYININYCSNLTLDDLSNKLELSSQYVSKIFKDKFGVNFIEYITLKRLNKAKRLLKLSNNKIKIVAKKSGYEDANYFCRIFKKYVGQTPKEYRNKL